MADPRTPRGPAALPPDESALPSTTARALAFLAIVVSGICGGLIGWKVTDLSLSGDAGVWPGIGGLVGAIVAAAGVGIVSILVLRAMSEWDTIQRTGDPTAARRNRP